MSIVICGFVYLKYVAVKKLLVFCFFQFLKQLQIIVFSDKTKKVTSEYFVIHIPYTARLTLPLHPVLLECFSRCLVWELYTLIWSEQFIFYFLMG